jgi:nucleotide-binding universal stress UspA family protein
MKTIVVPTDFSEYAQCALDVAYQIALKTKSEICLLNICQMNDYGDPVLGTGLTPSATHEYIKQVKESVGKVLEDTVAQEKYAQVMIRPSIEFGSLASQINSTVARTEASLVVMGTKGSSGMGELILGSNTERVIRTATCPVLVVPFSYKPFDLKNVVVPTTLQPNQVNVLRGLAHWQTFYDFQVHLLYINNPQNYQGDGNSADIADNLAKEAGLKNYEFYTSAAFNEENAIFEFAEQRKADLIVMGTNQRTGLAHFFLGSLTEDVANHSKIPILSISLKHSK